MKKAKLILSFIVLLSIIGGILAFRSQQTYSANYFCYIKDSVQVIHGADYTPAGTDCVTPYCSTQAGGTYHPTLFCTEN